MNMVAILCTHYVHICNIMYTLCKRKNETCCRNGGGGIKEHDGRGKFNYDIL
jgi:hypothetical protein